MTKLHQLINQNKKLLVSIALVICYFSGLFWISDYTEELISAMSKVRYLSYAMFAVLALNTGINELQKYYNDTKNIVSAVLSFMKDHLYFMAWAIVSVLVVLATHHLQPLVFLMMITAVADTGFDSHIRTIFYTHICFMLTIVFLHKFGFVSQITARRPDGTFRISCGYIFPLELQGHFLFILLMYIYLRKSRFRLNDVLLTSLFNVFLFEMTDARTDFYVGMLVIIVAFVINLFGADKIVRRMHLWFWELCALASVALPFVLVKMYNPAAARWQKLDSLLSTRLTITSGVIKTTGFPLFGTVMEWIGLGNTGRAPEGKELNWIDFSFVKDAVDYGWVFVVLLVIGIAFMIAWAYRKHDVFGMIMFEGVMLSCVLVYHSFLPNVYPIFLALSEGILLKNGEFVSTLCKRKV